MSVPPRTTAPLVQAMLGGDYGPVTPGGALPDLSPYIALASTLVDQVKVVAENKQDGTNFVFVPIDTGVGSQAELLERLLACHYYCVMDPAYKSRTTAGASGGLDIGTEGTGLNATKYGRQAIAFDYSGVLANMTGATAGGGGGGGGKARAGFNWLGKRVSDQVPYWQRN